jgi:ATP-dependent DNA helicase RecG
VPGGDSTNRTRSAHSLLEQLFDIDRATEASNRVVHIPGGFAHGQVHAIPSRAAREAIVNGVVHRDWLSAEPTTVEHIGDVLIVTSPGGFIGGIAPSNIITHPAVPRYRSLAEAMATLRLAEREGVGVDRMVRDMLALGHRVPDITEIPGPCVRIALVGGPPDFEVTEFLTALAPVTVQSDVDALLLITHLCRCGWIDANAAAPVLQRSPTETVDALDRLSVATIDDEAVIMPIKGTPPGEPPGYRLGVAARRRLTRRLSSLAAASGRSQLIVTWARARGRVSSTEVSDLTGVSVPYAGTLLTALAEEGLLVPARVTKMGRGFHYLPAL